MDYLSLFSMIQIITEMIPVSSSTHIFFISYLKKISLIHFHVWLYFLHLCTVLVLAIYFFNRWTIFFTRKSLFIKGIYIASMVISADIITILLYSLFKSENIFFIFLGLMLTSISLFIQNFIPNTCNCNWNFKKACILGFMQGIAFLPGISRLAITTATARLIGFCTRHAFEAAWMIAVPLFVGAGFVSAYDLYKEQCMVTKVLFTTIVVATIISYYVIKYVHALYLANKWWLFGIYVFILMVIFLFFSFFSHYSFF